MIGLFLIFNTLPFTYWLIVWVEQHSILIPRFSLEILPKVYMELLG